MVMAVSFIVLWNSWVKCAWGMPNRSEGESDKLGVATAKSGVYL